MGKSKLAKEKQLSTSVEGTFKETFVGTDAHITNLLSRSAETKLFDEFLKTRSKNEKNKQRLMSLKLYKLEEEERWKEYMEDNAVNELQIGEDDRDEYEDIESRK